MRRSFICLLICFGAGCGGSDASYGVAYSGGYSQPELAYVGPNVYAVANWDRPVFYSDNYYWLYDNNSWYRSRYHTGGWARANAPSYVRGIDRPERYRRYRADRTYTPPRTYDTRRHDRRSYDRRYDTRRYDTRRNDTRRYQPDRRTYEAPRRNVPQATPRVREAPRRVEAPRGRDGRDDRRRGRDRDRD